MITNLDIEIDLLVMVLVACTWRLSNFLFLTWKANVQLYLFVEFEYAIIFFRCCWKMSELLILTYIIISCTIVLYFFWMLNPCISSNFAKVQELSWTPYFQVWHRRTFQQSGLFAARIDLQGSTLVCCFSVISTNLPSLMIN